MKRDHLLTCAATPFGLLTKLNDTRKIAFTLGYLPIPLSGSSPRRTSIPCPACTVARQRQIHTLSIVITWLTFSLLLLTLIQYERLIHSSISTDDCAAPLGWPRSILPAFMRDNIFSQLGWVRNGNHRVESAVRGIHTDFVVGCGFASGLGG